MKTKEIVELGTKLGIPFDAKRTYKDLLDENYVVFDGVNNQRFSIDGNKLTDDEIYAAMGRFLIQMGRREICMEHNRLMSIT